MKTISPQTPRKVLHTTKRVETLVETKRTSIPSETQRKCTWRDTSHRLGVSSVAVECWKTGSPTTQICLTLTKAHWMSWMLGRYLSRSDLTTSLGCGWLFMMAVKTLQQHKAYKNQRIPHVFKKSDQKLISV